MFEDALVESRHLVRSRTARWTAVGSFAMQAALAAVAILVPLTRTERLPHPATAPRLELPPAPPPVVVKVRRAVSSAVSRVASLPVEAAATAASGRSLSDLLHSAGDEPAPAASDLHMGDGGTGPAGILGDSGGSTGPAVVRAAPATGPVRISSGVTAGMLAEPIRPVYPAIAKAARVEGAVVLAAVISKTGAIESLRVASGPAMLRQAALDAVRAARYRPYTLNGRPVAVETSITVVFRLGS